MGTVGDIFSACLDSGNISQLLSLLALFQEVEIGCIPNICEIFASCANRARALQSKPQKLGGETFSKESFPLSESC